MIWLKASNFFLRKNDLVTHLAAFHVFAEIYFTSLQSDLL